MSIAPAGTSTGDGARQVLALPVPAGADAATVLSAALRDALSGSGPAVHPHPAGTHPLSAVAAGAALAATEDDPSDPTAAVVATSGSTGQAKPALLGAAAMLASASATHDRLGGPGSWLLGVPAHTVAGVMVCVRSLVSRTTAVSCDLSRGFTAEAFTEAAARSLAASRGGRRYASLVPTQVARVLGGGPEALEALAGFDAVLVGGAALPTAIRDAGRSAGVRLVETYGSSETCGGCVYDGVPLDGVTIEVGEDGRITVGGEVVARGYRLRPADPAFLVDQDHRRRFVTDDTGRWRNGRLEVLGRVDDMIVTGGYKVSPRTVEDALRAQPGVADVAVVALPDPQWGQRVVAVVVPTDPAALAPDARSEAGAWRAAVAARLGRWAAPDIRLVADIPLTGPGKPDRRAVVDRLSGAATPQETGPQPGGRR